MQRTYALEGIRVVDFSWIFSGPIATKFLADHGAEVIKIESNTKPDETRNVTPFKNGISGLNRSLLFANYNTSKLGMTIDLTQPKGIEIVKKLIGVTDIVVEAFSPGTMTRLGLDYNELQKVKPDIIMLSMSMYGQTGPFSQRPTLGMYLQSLMGFTELLGWPDRPPVIPPTPYPDYISPWFILTAILGALDYRRREGKGIYVDLSQLEGGLYFLAPAILDYTVNQREQTRRGNSSNRAAPHGAYRCKGDERWCVIAVYTDEEWVTFCKVIGKPELVNDPKYATLLGRKKNEDELNKLVEEWTELLSPETITSQLQQAGIEAAIVQNGEDIVDKDPQIRHRQHYRTLYHPEIGEHIVEVAPFILSKTPVELQRSAPCLGEHNEYICREILQLSDEEFVGLVNLNVF